MQSFLSSHRSKNLKLLYSIKRVKIQLQTIDTVYKSIDIKIRKKKM